MDETRFDNLARRVDASGLTRRGFVRLLSAVAVAGPLALPGLAATAAKKGGKGKKKGKGKGGKKQGPEKQPPCSANLQTDPVNCGACGNACIGSAVCVNGRCVDCPHPKILCNGACVDLRTHVEHCGQCGHACKVDPELEERDEICREGNCVCSGVVCTNGRCCPEGWASCIGTGDGCCPTDYHACPNGQPVDCCPKGLKCGGTCGKNCCP